MALLVELEPPSLLMVSLSTIILYTKHSFRLTSIKPVCTFEATAASFLSRQATLHSPERSSARESLVPRQLGLSPTIELGLARHPRLDGRGLPLAELESTVAAHDPLRADSRLHSAARFRHLGAYTSWSAALAVSEPPVEVPGPPRAALRVHFAACFRYLVVYTSPAARFAAAKLLLET